MLSVQQTPFEDILVLLKISRIFLFKKTGKLKHERYKFMKIFFIFLFFLLFGLGLWLNFYFNRKIHLESSVVFEIEKGTGIKKTALDLAERKIIQYPRLFSRLFQVLSRGSKLKYGEYELRPGDSYRELIEKLTSGQNYQYQITFFEGDHQYKYASQLERRGLVSSREFLKLSEDQKFIKKLFLEFSPAFWKTTGLLNAPGEAFKSGKSDRQGQARAKGLLAQNSGSGWKQISQLPFGLEGYLFPDTYLFSKNDGAEKIIKTMVQRFFEKIKNIDFSQSELSPHQVVILASIVEKETGADFERPLISSVFHNRLKKKMKLQTDPTILYGILKKTGKETNNIRKKDILTPTGYNTYVIKGLPPGPISNPGIEAIKAVLKPRKSDKLYFVSKNDGTHVFSKNYRDHLRAVGKYQKKFKKRNGKSR